MLKQILLFFISLTLLAANNPGGALRDMIGLTTKNNSIAYVKSNLPNYVDVDGMSAAIAGRSAWLRASLRERNAFTNKLSNLLIDRYADVLINLDRYRYDFMSREGASRQVIRITNPNSSYSTIVVFFNLKRGKWLVSDSSFNGVSLISQWRAKLSNKIKANGLSGAWSE